MKRALIAFGALAAVACLALLARQQQWFSRDAARRATRPNIVLITLDTFRADRVRAGLTPNLEKLAGRGVRFTNVRATAPLTLPSHASIMTGLTPPQHGVRENGVVFDRKAPTLARLLRDNGYATGAFVGAYVLNARFGLNEGFETYDDAVRRDPARAEQLEAERPGADVIDAALKWLPPSAPQKPFFLWVHLYDAHAPYAGGYDAEVAGVDAQVGRLLDVLDERKLAGSTVLAVAGDHGEALGEHGEDTHGMLVYDATLRVPLIIAAPGYGAGSFDAPLSLTHVAGTLLDVAGVRRPEGMCGAAILSRPGEAGSAPVECDVYSESIYPRRAGWHAVTALSDRQWKLVESSERELYDVQADPAERSNVAASHGNVVQAMAARLGVLQRSTAAVAAAVPADAAERLRALGYVSGGHAAPTENADAPNPARTIGDWVLFEGALDRLRQRRASEALPALRSLAGRYPAAMVFQTTYALALKETGKPVEAVAVYRKAVARWPSDATLFHDLAVAARDAGDSREAERAEQAALALDAENPMALNGLGLMHADAGRAAEAEVEFSKAAQHDPGNPSYWTNLGNARRALGNAISAETAYRRALAIDADYPDALNGLGALFVQSARARDAIPLFERAVARDPDLHEARLNLGIAYQESGQKEKAAVTYRDVLAKAPASARREREAAAQLLRALR